MSMHPGFIPLPPAAPSAAKRSWFARHKVLTGLGAFVLVGGIAAGASGGAGKSETTVTPAASTTVTTPVAEVVKPAEVAKPAEVQAPAAPVVDNSGPSATLPKTDGDWRLDSFSYKEDGLGSFGGIGRVTYIGEDTDAGNIFTITVFKGDEILGSLMGSLSDMGPGQTKTVDFISFDDYVPGKLTFTFQNDL